MKKKKIVIASITLGLAALLTAGVAFAKSEEVKRTEEYCMVVATSNLLGTKVSISVDKGQEVKLFRNTGAVKDDEGKLKKFNTVVDALNYMNEDGWEFVDAYSVTVGQQNVYHYMMKRATEVKQ
jgi:hypothetical protein